MNVDGALLTSIVVAITVGFSGLLTAIWAVRRPTVRSTTEEVENLKVRTNEQDTIIAWMQRRISEQERRMTDQERELGILRGKINDLQDENTKLRAMNDALSRQLSGYGPNPSKVQRASTILRKTLTERFSEDELRSLAQDMGIVYDDLGGVGKTAKARELLDYCERHNKIAELIATIKNARPDLKEVA